jgi:hypothetical protein
LVGAAVKMIRDGTIVEFDRCCRHDLPYGHKILHIEQVMFGADAKAADFDLIGMQEKAQLQPRQGSKGQDLGDIRSILKQ